MTLPLPYRQDIMPYFDIDPDPEPQDVWLSDHLALRRLTWKYDREEREADKRLARRLARDRREVRRFRELGE